MQVSRVLAIVIALAGAPQLGVNAAILQLESSDPTAVAGAASMLKARGTDVLPVLVKTAHDNSNCQVQYMLAGIIRDLQPDSPVPNATLLGIALGKCKMKPPQDAIMQRQAAFALADRADGVASITNLLQTGDGSLRRTATLAFLDLMKVFSADTAKTAPTPELVVALKPALAMLARTLNDSDVYVRCGAFNALTEALKVPADDLKQQAAKLLEGVTPPKCPSK